jgi:hypothetical protein
MSAADALATAIPSSPEPMGAASIREQLQAEFRQAMKARDSAARAQAIALQSYLTSA